MNKNEQWLKWAVELQAIAQGGLFYGKDKFDIERYERIREISAEMISYKTEISTEKVQNLFCSDVGSARYWRKRKVSVSNHVFCNSIRISFLLPSSSNTVAAKSTRNMEMVSREILGYS